MSTNTGTQDSGELEALFDSTRLRAEETVRRAGAGGDAGGVAVSKQVGQAVAANAATQDSDDLEALFDSIILANNDDARSSSADVETEQAKLIQQIGHMARTLHDAIRELGLNKEIEKAAATIPDARDRLNYVATLTQQAAERVLNATEAAQPVVEKAGNEAQRLAGQWDMLFEKKLDVQQFKDLVTQTHAYLHEMPKQAKVTNAYLVEIMLAQDFQDLTGQVIKKVIDVTQQMEQQLLSVLLDNAPAGLKAELNNGLLNGPVINPHGRSDVVTSQDQVDDLLESLGF